MNRIKELRKNKGITQDRLAGILCVKRSAVSKYETGASTLTDETITQLAAYFGVSTDRVLGFCPFNDEQLVNLRTFLSVAVIKVTESDAEASDSVDLFDLMHDIIDRKVLPTYEDIYSIANEWRFSLDEMFGALDLVKREQKKLVTISDDELDTELIDLLDSIPQAKKPEAVRYLRYIVTTEA